MAFTLKIPSVPPEHFDQAVEMVLADQAKTLGPTGSTHSARIAADAVKQLLKAWDVAKDPDRTFGAIIAGHANPGGEAPEGFGNDIIEVTLWRSGNREPKVAAPAKPAALPPKETK